MYNNSKSSLPNRYKFNVKENYKTNNNNNHVITQTCSRLIVLGNEIHANVYFARDFKRNRPYVGVV